MAETPVPSSPVPVVAVAVTPDAAQLDRWTLALLALGIPHQVIPAQEGDGRALLVRAVDEARARHTLAEVEEEQRQQTLEQARKRPPVRTPRWAILWAEALAAAITAISWVAGSRGDDGPWMQRGHLDSNAVFAGQLWRLVTAVTLHADAAHLLGNLAFMMVLAPAIIHRMGPGVVAGTIIWSGVIGNFVTIGFHGPDFGNVGASGGIFGLAGVLGLLSARVGVSRIGANRWVLGTGGALGLLAMLAFGENADVVAHVAGFFAAAPIGLWAPLRPEARPDAVVPRGWWPWQALLLLAASGVVVLAWWAAWGFPH